MKHAKLLILSLLCIIVFFSIIEASGVETEHGTSIDFPKSIEYYQTDPETGFWSTVKTRASVEPFNVAAFVIFMLAIIHTFLTSRFMAISHKLEREYQKKIAEGNAPRNSIHMGAGILHFLGEIEAVFGIWVIGLLVAIAAFYNWDTAVFYVGHKVHYTEGLFVIVMMTIASSRPVLKMFELLMWKITNFLGGTVEIWWIVILTIGPMMGAFIAESAAMTISACLLAEKFFTLNPSTKMKYATIGLLFVNISVGGTLSNFVAPPVLMVSEPWGWDFMFMMTNFGWKAALGIVTINLAYFFYFRKDLKELQGAYKIQSFKNYIQRRYLNRYEIEERLDNIEIEINHELGFTSNFDEVCDKIEGEIREHVISTLTEDEVAKYGIDEVIDDRFNDLKLGEMQKTIPGLLPNNLRPPYRDPNWDNREDKVPLWIMLVHLGFMIWTVVNAKEPVLFIGGFLFFLGFVQVTPNLQNRINLKPPLMVGFFLSGLVIHGGLQAWWIEPLLSRLSEVPLLLSATVLTAFNDNAGITYLSTLVPTLTESMKYTVMVGAVSGGGLTIIANAPNPVGVSILKRFFDGAVSPIQLLKAALIPTALFLIIFSIL